MPRNPDAYQVTEEEVLDVIRDGQYPYRNNPTINDLHPVDQWTIAAKVLGFDPLSRKNTNTQFGGRSKSTWVNEHLSMSTLTRVLDGLVEDGTLVKVSRPNFREEKAAQRLKSAVLFHRNRSGWVTREALDAAYDRLDVKTRNSRRRRLLEAARAQIADKYAKQVKTVYDAMCAEAGMEPLMESEDLDEV